MADPELIAYIRTHLKTHGAEAVRRHLIEEGVLEKDVDSAFKEAVRKPRLLAKLALCGGVFMLMLAGYLSVQKPQTPKEAPPEGDAAKKQQEDAASADSDNVFRGHYGFMVKLPAGYAAEEGFADPAKTQEVVHIYPIGTDPTNFIHEGLYGQLGILRIDVVPRRRPAGPISLNGVKSAAPARLAAERATYTQRPLMVNAMQGFVVTVTEPFAYARAYLVGQKVVYTVSGGADNDLFNALLSSLLEISPHDDPGK